MRLCGLLLTLSLVLADENGNDIHDSCEEALNSYGSKTALLMKNHENCINSSISEIPCFIYNVNLLSCSWSTDSLPEDAQYSASFHTPMDYPLKCKPESSKKLVECQGRFEEIHEHLTVKVNISINGYLCIICQNYIPADIEKLDPPQNITTVTKSTNLEIQWQQPSSCCTKKSTCFIYELKINNEPVQLEGYITHTYNITNFDPTRSYTIQMRSKPENTCSDTKYWSDWSKAMVVKPSGNIYKLNTGVILSIAFVLPMILLAFLLVCKFQRLFEKLFPSIPNPSRNVQMLLEKNDFNQVTPPKQSEEGAEILEVIG
ncbi:interleukin-5 receptor subunit alpha isoform X1 [Pangasianodon hypophthalmus]|uniref:interleukin-5 receptor subunit alpha isoform X1 n=1 Tax=Pangasianodon hypophthalmus TaxID=310915 RepID=UPI002306ED8C|nr:interleukin-5 receptor subunit alpha isoform X1 [Pangasianodon hypophthalmus]XP_034155771.2 interleukin-5 receptor subunit alpha isoform X1 [Pangasianodon hypophthalmus]